MALHTLQSRIIDGKEFTDDNDHLSQLETKEEIPLPSMIRDCSVRSGILP